MKKDSNQGKFYSQEEETPPKKKKFNLFDAIYARNEKKRQDLIYDPHHKRDFLYFFRMLFDHFSNLFYINLLMVFGCFPIFILLLVYSQNLHIHVSAPADALFAPIYGAMRLGAGSPISSAMYGLYGMTTDIALWTPLTKVLLVIGILLLAIVFGPVQVGAGYILRNIVKGEPVFLWSDFWYAIKRNKKQEFLVGILDFAFLCLIVYDILFFYININGTITGIFFYFGLIIGILYLVMRFYLYLMMVTFDLSVKKLLKNALIFTIIGMKRNLMALLGIALTIVLNLLVCFAFFPLGIVLPFIITLSVCYFIGVYAAWPKINEIMIEPYYDEDGNPLSEANE